MAAHWPTNGSVRIYRFLFLNQDTAKHKSLIRQPCHARIMSPESNSKKTRGRIFLNTPRIMRGICAIYHKTTLHRETCTRSTSGTRRVVRNGLTGNSTKCTPTPKRGTVLYTQKTCTRESTHADYLRRTGTRAYPYARYFPHCS